MSVLSKIQSDYLKHKKYGGNIFSILFFTQGFWATFQYRIAHSIYKSVRIPVLRQLILLLMILWQKLIEILTGISIPYSVTIGRSFYIGHFGGVIINANAVFGDNCNVSQGVTIGVSGRGTQRGVPHIKNNVYIGVNAVVAGNIVVNDNALIGANSLVVNDVDEFSTMLGVPAKKVNNKGSKGYI